MAEYEATVASSWTPEETFDYLADFRHVAQWDPNTERAELIAGEATQLGARYRLTMTVLGKAVELTYEAVEVQRPDKLVMRSEDDNLTSVDTITIGADASVTYNAHLDLKGLRKLVDPIAEVALTRASNKARDRLAETLAVPR